MQPKWLIAQLEEYAFLSQSVGSLTDEVRKVLMITETYGLEHSNRLDNDVHRFGTLYEQLMNDHRERWDDYHRRFRSTLSTLDKREEELAQAETSLGQSKTHQSFWQNQLALANAWEDRAMSRVRTAEAELESAEQEVASAESGYSSAKLAYDIARAQRIRVCVGRDSKGNDVYEYRQNPAHAERAAMDRAYSRLQSARAAEANAIREVQSARTELQKAQRQVTGSQHALSDMNVAVRHSFSSLSNAEDAKSNTLNAKYVLEREKQILEQIDEVLNAIEDCVYSQLSCQRELQQCNNVALMTLRNNEQVQDELVYEVYKVRYALDNKMNLLTVFDAPVFLG